MRIWVIQIPFWVDLTSSDFWLDLIFDLFTSGVETTKPKAGRSALSEQRYTSTSRMTPAFRWAVVWAVVVLHLLRRIKVSVSVHEHQTLERKERRSGIEPTSSSYQPNALPLGQTGPQFRILSCLVILIIKIRSGIFLPTDWLQTFDSETSRRFRCQTEYLVDLAFSFHIPTKTTLASVTYDEKVYFLKRSFIETAVPKSDSDFCKRLTRKQSPASTRSRSAGDMSLDPDQSVAPPFDLSPRSLWSDC